MRCVCCQSNRIRHRPLDIEEHYSCLDCGLIFRVVEKKDELRKWTVNHYEKHDPYEKVADSKQSFFNTVLGHLSSPFETGERTILDVGCGDGYFLDLAEKREWQTSGVEIAGGALVAAEQKVENHNIFHGTLKKANYSENSFDVITLWDVLFLNENPFEEIKECYRVLKRGGTIGIRVRNVFFQKIIYRAFSLFRKIASRLRIKNPAVFHLNCFSSKSIYQLLLRIGFTNIQIANSPLTKGDPYRHTAVGGLIAAAKALTNPVSRLSFWISRGKWITGPSLLVWAEKPKEIPKRQPGKTDD